jgi:putative ABC transport system permease protein
MIRTRTRKILRDIWARKARTFLVSASIFIGVFGVVTLVSAGELLINQLEEDIQEDELAMTRAQVQFSGEDRANVDNDAFLDALDAREGITEVEGLIVSELSWRETGSDDFDTATLAATTAGLEQTGLEPVRLVEGDWPQLTPDTEDIEIGVDRRFADANDLTVGDTLAVRLLRPIQPGDPIPTTTATITAIMFQPYGYPGTIAEGDSLLFANFEDAAFIYNANVLTNVYVRYEDFAQADADLGTFRDAIPQVSPYTVVFAQAENPAENSQIESTRSTNQILISLAVVALIVSGFLVVNVVSAIISEQRRQIGAMKSLGASTFDNFYIYAGIALAYGLIGVVPGVLLGIPAGYFAAQGLAGQSDTIIDEFGVVPQAIVAGGVIGLAVPFLASIFPVLNGTRVSILDAITDQGIKSNFGQGRLERSVANLPIPLAYRQSLNNAFQKKGRLFLTGLTLTLANGAFMGIFAVFFGLTNVVDSTFGIFGFQIDVDLQRGANIQQVEEDLRAEVDGLRYVEPAINIAITIEDYDAEPITAGPPGVRAQGFNTRNPEITDLALLEGDGWENDPEREGVVISARIANEMGLGDGDTITIIANGVTRTFDIIGVVNYPFDQIWFEWTQLAEYIGFVDEQGNPLGNRLNIVLEEEDPSVSEVDDKIDEISEQFRAQGINVDSTNQVQLNQIILSVVIALGVVFSLAALLIAAVGGVGLLTTLSISVVERQKEIGVMRSVGATSWSVALQFLIEGLAVGVVAFLLAIPISLGLRAVLIGLLPFDGDFDLSYPPETLVVGFVGMIVLVTVASLWPSFSAARKTVSEILRYQ